MALSVQCISRSPKPGEAGQRQACITPVCATTTWKLFPQHHLSACSQHIKTLTPGALSSASLLQCPRCCCLQRVRRTLCRHVGPAWAEPKSPLDRCIGLGLGNGKGVVEIDASSSLVIMGLASVGLWLAALENRRVALAPGLVQIAATSCSDACCHNRGSNPMNQA